MKKEIIDQYSVLIRCGKISYVNKPKQSELIKLVDQSHIF